MAFFLFRYLKSLFVILKTRGCSLKGCQKSILEVKLCKQKFERSTKRFAKAERSLSSSLANIECYVRLVTIHKVFTSTCGFEIEKKKQIDKQANYLTLLDRELDL